MFTTSQEVRLALDYGRLTYPLHEFIQRNVSPSYTNGGLMVEVRDFRHIGGLETYILPLTGRIFLQPTQQCLVADLDCFDAFESELQVR
jgi:hypothetical protein